MPDSALSASQLSMVRYLRNPAQQPAPAGLEPRRLKIYENLLYNNIEGFISGGFPVLRSVYTDEDWRALVRSFIDQHRCHTPYFLEISQEFLKFVMQDYQWQAGDPPYLAELAHYEWVEMALDISQDELPDAVPVADVLAAVVYLSPLAWSLRYRFPVHCIGPRFKPTEAAEPTYLVVYRDREDKVGFMELNVTTARLLEKVRDNQADTAGALLHGLAAELAMDSQVMLARGREQFKQLIDKGVVLVEQA